MLNLLEVGIHCEFYEYENTILIIIGFILNWVIVSRQPVEQFWLEQNKSKFLKTLKNPLPKFNKVNRHWIQRH